MKILAFSDVHGEMDILEGLHKKAVDENVDVVLCAGDMTVFGMEQSAIMAKIAEIPKPILVIHGNHEQAESLKADCESFDNLFFLHCASFRKKNVIFFGYGGGGFDTRDPAFVEISKKFKKDINENDTTVMMFHGPAYGTAPDTKYNEHVGNKDFTQFCKKNKITLVISGHIHETFGAEETIEGTTYLNPGPKGKIINL